MQILRILVSLATATSVAAHSRPQLSTRETAEYQAISGRCAQSVSAFTAARQKRSLAKRQALKARDTNVTIHTTDPHFPTIQNDTCILSPEVIAGPYLWPRSDTLRQDMSEDQPGVPLLLDIGVINTNTCEPVPNVLLDLWHCNATGSYSSFTTRSPNTPFLDLLSSLGKDINDPDLDLHSDNSTWLRGMWPTDDNGVMEMRTVFPGFYVQRTIHIHVRSHTDWAVRDNGTVVSSNVVSTGQMYFDEDLSRRIMALEPYASHTQINRTTNDADSIWAQGAATGWSPNFHVEPLDGEDVAKGMVGYITLGIDLNHRSAAGLFGGEEVDTSGAQTESSGTA